MTGIPTAIAAVNTTTTTTTDAAIAKEEAGVIVTIDRIEDATTTEQGGAM